MNSKILFVGLLIWLCGNSLLAQRNDSPQEEKSNSRQELPAGEYDRSETVKGPRNNPSESDTVGENNASPASPTSEIQPHKIDNQHDDKEADSPALIQNDVVLFGLLMAILGAIFYTSSLSSPGWKLFYKFVPMVLLCYFVPALLTLFGIADPHTSQLYSVAKKYFLPASLVLLTLSIDLKEILRLGPKALTMFFTGTVGVIIGGPIAVLLVAQFQPEMLGSEGPEELWRGLSTVAGSWIGGGANQTAMKEVWEPSGKLFSLMVVVDVLVAEFWMMFLIIGVGKSEAIDRLLRADSSSVTRLQQKMENYSKSVARIPTMPEIAALAGIVFLVVGLSQAAGDWLAPYVEENAPALKAFSMNSTLFWVVVLSTTIGVGLSFTPIRKFEGVGASKFGTLFVFILVATIGLQMDLSEIRNNLGVFVIGLIWMIIHVGLMFFVAYLIRAPYFFLAVGSKANIGGAASAPVIAAAFHPSLAPVGVLLAVLGYALGTYGALLCAWMMRAASGF